MENEQVIVPADAPAKPIYPVAEDRPLYKDGARDSRDFDANGNLIEPERKQPKLPAMRAKFIVTEVTQTKSGVKRLKLAAAYDHTTGDRKAVAKLGHGPIPVGDLTIEVAQDNAAEIDAVFYLISA
jgi:hypothetical protein